MGRFRKQIELPIYDQINITSLVDVTMTLLLIFMIATPLFQGGVEVVLPKTQEAQSFTFTGLVVTLSKDKGIYLNDESVAEADLADKLVQYYASSPVKAAYLRADEDIAYRKVIMIVGMIKQAGFESLGLVAEPSTANAPVR